MANIRDIDGSFPGQNLFPFRREDMRGSLRRDGQFLILRLDSTRHLEFWIEGRLLVRNLLAELAEADGSHADLAADGFREEAAS